MPFEMMWRCVNSLLDREVRVADGDEGPPIKIAINIRNWKLKNPKIVFSYSYNERVRRLL